MEELRAGRAMRVGGVTVIPIERCLLRSETGRMGGRLVGVMEPLAVVVCDAAGVRAFDAQADEIAVQSLVRQVPGLDAVLAPLQP